MTIFYDASFMHKQRFRREHKFEGVFEPYGTDTSVAVWKEGGGGRRGENLYRIWINIGFGYVYYRYNNLMYFLNVAEGYWNNPDLSNIPLFGEDVRVYWWFRPIRGF